MQQFSNSIPQAWNGHFLPYMLYIFKKNEPETFPAPPGTDVALPCIHLVHCRWNLPARCLSQWGQQVSSEVGDATGRAQPMQHAVSNELR